MTTAVPPAGFLAPDNETPRPHPDGATDAEAPYGRRADGTPKAKPGRPSGTPNTSPRAQARRRTQTAAPPRAPRAAPKTKQPAGPDYRGGVNGLIQLAAAPLAMAGIKSDTAAADAVALTLYGPAVANALHELALERPEIAAVLERILSVGPYGALLSAVLPLALQLLTNHQVIPLEMSSALGALPPADLVDQMRQAA